MNAGFPDSSKVIPFPTPQLAPAPFRARFGDWGTPPGFSRGVSGASAAHLVLQVRHGRESEGRWDSVVFAGLGAAGVAGILVSLLW
jgi:hypothetical protein